MGKKSAVSKGYRKAPVKKPYLTKKEVTVIAAVIAMIALAVVLFNVLYDDGSLKVVGGKVAVEGENSLIVKQYVKDAARYYKVGQVAQVEGYTLAALPSSADENVVQYRYTPDEASAIDEVTVDAFGYEAQLLGEATMAAISSASGVECDEAVRTAEANGHDVIYYVYTQPREASADAETDADWAYLQNLAAYIQTSGQSCIVLHVKNFADSEAEYLTDAEIVDVMNRFLPAISYETK